MVKRTLSLRTCAILFLIVFMIIGTGCMTLDSGQPFMNRDQLMQKNYPSPQGATLVFGHIYRSNPIFGKLGISQLDFAQIDPAYEAMWLYPGKDGTMFFLAPVPTGCTVHLVSYIFTEGKTRYYGELGLQKGYDITVETREPGLMYAGCYSLENLDNVPPPFSSRYRGFKQSNEFTEYDALKKLMPRLNGTQWETLVVARMEELKNER